ncbi:exoribonuclease [Microthyrium microscopicum]|uniref:Exosome complex component RRP45 n=1 Tax=Microthyrium microscopicum TaxID=703497 RepID=A0A6A6UUX8_9PEZI|nr:exoribonuclease [Microthyrium microscopicum]
MPREAELSNNERSFILQALQENQRIDARPVDQYRKLDIKFGEDYGSVDIALGKTQIAVRLSCEVTAPYPERKFDGIFIISCEFSPMASPEFEIGRPNLDEILLSRILEKAIRRSSALDTESLCIVAGSKCFALRADIHVLDHDGNLIDAACIALMTALQHFRRPDVTVDGDSVTVHDIREREPVALSLIHHPLCVTFSHYNEGKTVLVDATQAEEQVRDGQVIITMNRHGELCQIAKYGGAAVDAYSIVNWSNMALPQVQTLSELIKAALDDDAKKRDAGGLMAELSAENER